MHGDQDSNVILRHSQLMYDRMTAAHQDVTLYVAKGGQHGSGGPGWENHNAVAYDFFRRKFETSH
jgi:dipeptidyl aminopeptidase/acylaminoacyl peptidase